MIPLARITINMEMRMPGWINLFLWNMSANSSADDNLQKRFSIIRSGAFELVFGSVGDPFQPAMYLVSKSKKKKNTICVTC